MVPHAVVTPAMNPYIRDAKPQDEQSFKGNRDAIPTASDCNVPADAWRRALAGRGRASGAQRDARSAGDERWDQSHITPAMAEAAGGDQTHRRVLPHRNDPAAA